MATLLRCGAAAAPLYLILGYAQALAREGFDMRRHALSVLSNGELGWIQILNFIACGSLVIAGAVGVRRALAGGRGGTWGPILFATYGAGLIGAGVFVADAAAGFPPGSPPTTALSTAGMLHFVFGAIGFYALIGACFVCARRFMALEQRGWAAFSAVTGVAFFVSFAMIASGSAAPAVMLAFYAAVTWVWIWHSAMHLKLLRDRTPMAVAAPDR